MQQHSTQLKRSSGYSVLEVIVVTLALAIVAAAAWWLWRRQPTPPAAPPGHSVAHPATLSKSYMNTEYGFRFQYPANWKLQESLTDIGRGHKEGKVAVTSPGGVVVTFEPNLGGKGGDCLPDPADTPHHTTNCNTREVLSAERLPDASSAQRSVYLYHTKYTPAGTATQTEYGIFIDTTKLPPGPTIGAVFNFGIVAVPIGDIYTSVSGVNNHSIAYFRNPQVHQAEAVLRSFRLTH